MLGREVLSRLSAAGERPAGWDRAALDVTDRRAVLAAVAAYRPNVAVNCAAWTAVDRAEACEDEALAVNGDGPRHLADACARYGGRLIHVSTDYVFAGYAHTPYGEAAATGPATAYGRTKLAGERAVLASLPDNAVVLRTAWLYGVYGHNFVRTMMRRAAGTGLVDVVGDQFGQPTWAADVAERVLWAGRAAGLCGVLHATNAGVASWYDLAREVFALTGHDPRRVRPTTARAWASPAPRPVYTALGHARWAEVGGPRPRHWRAALRAAVPLLR